MLSILRANTNSSRDQDVWDSLAQLKKNVPESLIETRGAERIPIRVPVIIRSANLSERDGLVIDAETGDVSETGCLIVVSKPRRVGDFYNLEFNRSEFDRDPTTARCLRCRWIRENWFETGFEFFGPTRRNVHVK